jgi:hypothetical protein
MVAFKSGRRQQPSRSLAQRSVVDTLTAAEGGTMDSVFHAGASHRAVSHVEIHTCPDGLITQVRIGRWRVVTAGDGRRLAEVRELGCRRVALRIERFADDGVTPSSEIWQLYNLDGRLEAALQTTPDGKFAMMTNYRTRQACRLAANSKGELQAVETWKI